jgi:hypothetical protein
MSLRKIIKMRGSFPNEDAAMKLLYWRLALASSGLSFRQDAQASSPVVNPAERLEKMDHAGADLEWGLESLQHSLAGADARPGSRLNDAGGKRKTIRKGAFLDLGALPPSPWDLTHSRQDCWNSAERAALARAESRPLSRRSGRFP